MDKPRSNITSDLFSNDFYWLWFITSISTLNFIASLFLTNEGDITIYFRYAIGSLCILFFPGYSLNKIIFPQNKKDSIENIPIVIGLSLIITPSLALLLNYTPFGITYMAINTSFFLVNIILAFIAAYRGLNN